MVPINGLMGEKRNMWELYEMMDQVFLTGDCRMVWNDLWSTVPQANEVSRSDVRVNGGATGRARSGRHLSN